VLVTGAARGQGRAHATAFARNGADIVAADAPGELSSTQYDVADAETLAETVRQVRETGSRAMGLELDVRDEDAVEGVVDEAVARFGRIDVLINNAAIWTVRDAVELSEESWDETIDVNLKGTWLCAKHVARHVRARGGGGRIVNVASIGGLVGTAASAHYAAAKHGVVGLTKTLALELAEHDVTVNAVCPTGVDTPMIEGIVEHVGEEAMQEVSDFTGSMNVIDDQLVPPEAVSGACLWLASENTRYVTGTAVPVDAGALAK